MEILVNRSTNSVTLGTAFLTTKLDLSSMDPLVESVVWDTATQKGTKYFGAEAMVDGYLRPQEQILGVEYRRLVGPIVDLAMEHWDARKNPYVMYRTGGHFNEGEYIGQKVLITTYPHPTEPPEGFTTIESPNPSEYDPFVQWTGTEWYRAPWKFDADVAIQKEDLKNYIKSQVATFINNQLRIYSMYDIIDSGGTLRPADSRKHGHVTMDSYINEINTRVAAAIENVDSAKSSRELLQINFNVSDLF